MAVKGLEMCDVGAVRFAYPTGWTREIEEADDGVNVSLQSGGVSFAIVGVYPPDFEPDDLLEQALDSLREEHPTLETEDLDERGLTEEGASAEAVFISLDAVVYCWIRCWRVGGSSILVFVQSVEPEAEKTRGVFRAICKSMEAKM
jgi:hypothetical protein